MKYAKENHPAIREIDAVNREFLNDEYTADEHAAALEGALKRHGARKEVVKTHGNGINLVRVFAADGSIITEYHDAKEA